MHRFFVPAELLKETTTSISLPKDLAHQVRDVVRLNIGENLLLLDNSGDEVLAVVSNSNKGGVEVHLIERRAGGSEPAVHLTLSQGMLKSTRFEWILEKGTELGVSVFSPIMCRRSMAGLEDIGASKMQRWQRIIQEAAEQSGRSRLPQLSPIRPLAEVLNNIPSNALAIMPWEEEQALTLHDVLSTSVRTNENVGATLKVALPDNRPDVLPVVHSDALPDNRPDAWSEGTLAPQTPLHVFLFIGPEGGLTSEEVALARARGVQVVSLGSRILRAETAAIATIANVLYELEK